MEQEIYGIWYTSSNNFGLVGYADSEWVGSFAHSTSV